MFDAETSTDNVQLSFPGIKYPDDMDTEDPPAVAVNDEPTSGVQVVLALGVAAITRPVGRLSVKDPVNCESLTFILLKVTVSVEVPVPASMLAGLKLLLTSGAQSCSVMVLELSVTAPFRAKA